MNSTQDILNTAYPLLLFDGVCNLCDASVQFIIKRDPQKKFRFASLQSGLGQKVMQAIQLPSTELSTMVLVDEGKYYLKSSAALHAAKKLTGIWPILFAFMVVPPVIRNAVYDFIARNRYRWFGRKRECMIPTPELKERFLE